MNGPRSSSGPTLRRAAERGVTTAAIGEVVRVATSGDFDPLVARLNLDNRQVYIRVRIADASRQDIETLANLRVTGRGGPVPLSSVANLSMESGPSQIDRYDRHRYVTVGADLGGMPLGAALTAAQDLPAARGLPSSVQLIQTGDAEIAAELIGIRHCHRRCGALSVLRAGAAVPGLPPAGHHPFRHAAVPGRRVRGAAAGARSELDMPSMIGFIMLMGIVTKNSILLVEYAIVSMRDRGLSRRDAVLYACHKRARPIVMTTVAMIAGMLPIALGLGADSSFRQPMAISVIGGLLTSTALSLLVVPVVFTYVDDFERWVARLWRHEPPARGSAEPV